MAVSAVLALATLWSAYRRGDDEQRRRIVEAPNLFLRASQSVSPPASVALVAQRLDEATRWLDRARETLVKVRESDPTVGQVVTVKAALGRVAAAHAALMNAGAGDA